MYKLVMFLQFRVIPLILWSALKRLFCVLCVGEQMQAICNDETAVEQAKKQGSHRLNISKKALLAEVFGRGKLVLIMLMDRVTLSISIINIRVGL